MRLLLSILFFLSFYTCTLFSQNRVDVLVTLDGEAISEALLTISEKSISTDTLGRGEFANIANGRHRVLCTYSYLEAETEIDISSDTLLHFPLEREVKLGELIVKAVKVEANSPIPHTQMDRAEIEKKNLAQDVPYLLKWHPSVVSNSDAGAGVGYTSMRIRGSDMSRTNVTINGIPYNDSESQGVFWVNMPNILESTQSIQVQRGVGTSTLGAGAFGASVNLNTMDRAIDSRGALSLGYGSFNTFKVSLSGNADFLDEKLKMNARLSYVGSDGYIDRASSDLKSYYLSGTYEMEKSKLTAIAFGGHERTYQAWYGLPVQYIETDSLRTYNPAGTERGADAYEDQVDNYTQLHHQLHYSRRMKENIDLSLALHYTRGYGYYEEYKADEDFDEYGISSLSTSGDLIRRRWLDNHFAGLVFTSRHSFSRNRRLTVGGAYNIYFGDHIGEVIEVLDSTIEVNKPIQYYFNTGRKSDANVYAKYNFPLGDKIRAYLDLQYRRVGYQFSGMDFVEDSLVNLTHQVKLEYLNPKVGLFYQIDDWQEISLFFGLAHKEPNRDDYTDNLISEPLKSERLYDTEFGYMIHDDRALLSLNLYYMKYRNQLVTNGKINDVGAYTRVNVPDSYRVGLELLGKFTPHQKVELLLGGTLSRNKIKEFEHYIDSWDTGEQVLEVPRNTNISFSPSIIAQSGIRYAILGELDSREVGNLILNLQGKYVGKQYLDNTSTEEKSLPGYFYSDAQLNYALPMSGLGRLELTLSANNLFNSLYFSNAWVYEFISEGYDPREFDPTVIQSEKRQGRYLSMGYFPQAGRHFMLGLKWKF